jgi:hypothetical protein
MKKNPHAQALGRLGGKAKSPKKTEANRAKAIKRWEREKRREHKTAPY